MHEAQLMARGVCIQSTERVWTWVSCVLVHFSHFSRPSQFFYGLHFLFLLSNCVRTAVAKNVWRNKYHVTGRNMNLEIYFACDVCKSGISFEWKQLLKTLAKPCFFTWIFSTYRLIIIFNVNLIICYLFNNSFIY